MDNNSNTFVGNTSIIAKNPPLIYSKMNAVMKDIGSIGKDQKNQAQGFKFRGIDQFVNTLYPALCKNGVFMTTKLLGHSHELKEVTRKSGGTGVDKHIQLVMEYTFWAEDGSSVSSTVPGEAVDSGDKGTNKALSAALKYALIQTFSIPTEDMAEADLESPEIGVPVAKQELPESTVATSSVTSFRKPKTATAPTTTTPTGGWK